MKLSGLCVGRCRVWINGTSIFRLCKEAGFVSLPSFPSQWWLQQVLDGWGLELLCVGVGVGWGDLRPLVN